MTASMFMAHVAQSRRKLARFNPDQERDSHGRWTDGSPDGDLDGDLDADADSGSAEENGVAEQEVRVYTTSTAAGFHLAAFEDPHSELITGGGRGVAMRAEGDGEIGDHGDLEDSLVMSQADANALAAALEALADPSNTHNSVGDDPVLVTSTRAGGLTVAVFDDPGGSDGEVRYLTIHDGDSPDADAALAVRPSDVPALAASLRKMSMAEPAAKAGVDPKLDRLRLDGRITLAPGERLTGSAKTPVSEFSYSSMLLAATDGPAGPRVRVSVDAHERPSDWDGDGDVSTDVTLDAAGVEALRAAVPDITAAGQAHKRAWRQAAREQDARIADLEWQIETAENDGTEESLIDEWRDELREVRQGWDGPESDAELAAGAIPAFDGAGALVWELAGDGGEDGGWQVRFGARLDGVPEGWTLYDGQAEPAILEPKHLRALLKTLDRLTGGSDGR